MSTRPIKLMLKIESINHTDRVDRRASTNLHTPNERCQFKLYIGYWTSNNNKWPKCSCRYQTPPDNTCANDVIDNDVTDNEVIDSWMNMHTLLASRPNVVASTRRDALGVNGALAQELSAEIGGSHCGHWPVSGLEPARRRHWLWAVALAQPLDQWTLVSREVTRRARPTELWPGPLYVNKLLT